ncbi:putative glycine receptor subunit alpha-2 [Penaeus vannamei]|uniref:Putative glycine receptor subunit alpha-2 n=1 Tax=Penaeus vannamei TaxID=6689 RepID=A0A423SHR1_PENVA|nr:putative glycine receptor subunit alpha-2 [Penaeus vannamei]
MVPANEEENRWLYNTTKDIAFDCSGGVSSAYLWLGATDEGVEGQWASISSGRPLEWQGPWRGAGPNGGNEENCLVMLTGKFPGRWSDIACLDTYSFCVPCEFSRPATIFLKGPAVCSSSPFNHQYYLGDEREGVPSLVGFFHSDIFMKNETWIMQSLKDPTVTAWWTPAKDGLYPFGTRQWTLGICGEGEFTCADGICIDLDKRCDLRVDCLDQSDEMACSLVDIPVGYRTFIPPPPPVPGEPLRIAFDVNVIAFPNIATQDLTFTATLLPTLRWQDTRLNFLNLKADRTLNLLSREASASIWTPRVFFSNAQGNLFTNLGEGSRVECVREGPPTPGAPSLPEEVNVFKGHENSLEMSQLYTATYSCDFLLAMFPFDSQECSLNFTLVSAASTYMVLEPGLSLYSGPTFLIEYQIGTTTISSSNEGEFSVIQVKVRFYRRYTFYLLTLYIPTVLLILIAYATFFFNPDDFNSRVVVAVTSLLVLTSLLTQTSNALLKTSYFKLIDIWLFVSIVIIFLVILLQTLVNFSVQKTRSNTADSFIGRLVNRITGPRVLASKNTRVINIAGPPRSSSSIVWGDEVSKTSTRTIRGGQEEGKKTRDTADLKDEGPDGVNMALMVKSRIVVPLIYLVFNLCYWGVAFRCVEGKGVI